MGNNSGKPGGPRSIRVNEADLPDLQRVFEQIGGGKKIKEHELTVCIFLTHILEISNELKIVELLEQSHLPISTERYLSLLVRPRKPSSTNYRLQNVH